MIFQGDWYDAFGVPFIPGAHVLETHSPGGAAANTPGGRIRRSSYYDFVRTVRGLRDRWDYQLSQADRDAWAAVAATPLRRDDDGYDAQGNGWLLFNALNFQFEYYADALDVNPPADPGAAGAAEFSIVADLADQSITYHFSYNALFGQDPGSAACIYHVDPRNCAGAPHRLHTRLIARESTFNPAGGVIDETAPAAWPFEIYPDVFALIRVHSSDVYRWNELVGATPS